MTDRYLCKDEIAALFGCSAKVAETQLAKAGLHPVDLGRGRGHGKRWLESAVLEAMRSLHEQAQPKPRARTPKPKTPAIGLASMSAGELSDFIARTSFTAKPTIQ